MYDKSTDFKDIQSDVLTIDLGTNEKVPKAKLLKTESKIITKAINALNDQLNAAANTANSASTAADSAANAVAEVKTNITNIIKEQITQKMTEIISGGIQNDEFNCTEGQVDFKLSKEPADKNNIIFMINGVKYMRTDFSYTAETNTVTWISLKSVDRPKGFSLSVADAVSIMYMSKS